MGYLFTRSRPAESRALRQTRCARQVGVDRIWCSRKTDRQNRVQAFGDPDGTGQTYVELSEQYNSFSNGLHIVPKLIADRKGVNASYPQITGGGSRVTAIENLVGASPT